MTDPKRLKIDGQAMRLLRWLRSNPDSSSLEITQALSVVNVTGRISDLRAAGYIVECRKGPDRRDRYRVVERSPAPLTGTQQAWSDYWDNAPGVWVADEASDAGSRR